MEAHLDPSEYCDSHHISLHAATTAAALLFKTSCNKHHPNLKKNDKQCAHKLFTPSGARDLQHADCHDADSGGDLLHRIVS